MLPKPTNSGLAAAPIETIHDPKGGVFRGRDEINRIAGVIKATHPDFEYRPLSPPEELGDAGRVRWYPALSANRQLTREPILLSLGAVALLRSISFSTIFLSIGGVVIA